MKISGFTMCRNAEKLYYPIAESIASVLPIVDEMIVALGKGDEDDQTRQRILSLNSSKIKIIDTVWDIDRFPRGMVHAHQTDVAKSYCSGDWLIYVQADEVLHESSFGRIQELCSEYLNDERVEGMLVDYKHFWGDYEHVAAAHGWYKKEIRVVRNIPEIHSWESAQSFRVIPDFDGIDYRKKEGSRKLNVIDSGAQMFHYGWVRPPEIMSKKMQALDQIHSHPSVRFEGRFEFGKEKHLEKFEGNHPAVMLERIEKLNWEAELWNSDSQSRQHFFKHEKWTNRVLGKIEDLIGGREIFGFQNYNLIR